MVVTQKVFQYVALLFLHAYPLKVERKNDVDRYFSLLFETLWNHKSLTVIANQQSLQQLLHAPTEVSL